jgi:hypothetical protein
VPRAAESIGSRLVASRHILFGVALDQFGGMSQLAARAVSFGTCGLVATNFRAPAQWLCRATAAP